MASRSMTLTVNINRNYGDHSIDFGISEIVHVKSGSHRRSAFNNLILQLNDQIELYETVNLKQIRLPETSTKSNNVEDNVIVLPITHIAIENKNGKKYMSGQGGQYSKHGVPIYADTCATDLVLDEYDYGVHDITAHNLKMAIDVVDGKPKRIIAIK